MDLELAGKRALVTGGSRGIGKAIARELAIEGCDVAIVARTEASLTAAAREIAAETGRKIVAVTADTSDDQSVRSMAGQVNQQLGGVDILVNCAAAPGGLGPRSLEQITTDDFWFDMNVKAMGYLRCAREVAPGMKAQGWGRIINISGLNARRTGSTIGSMRNVAVAALTKNLADELGPHGINVTIVHPGRIRTEATPALVQRLAEQDDITPEQAEHRLAQDNSTRRIIEAREIAYITAFLASPKSIAITGDAIAAGGGAGPAIYY